MDALSIIEAVAEMSMLGQTVLNVWHAVSTDAGDDDDAMDEMAAKLDDLYSIVNGEMDASLSYVGINFKNITENVVMGTRTWPSLSTGGYASIDALPLGVAACISFPTGIPGVRGRKFLPAYTEGSLVEALWNAATVDSLEDFAVDAVAGWLGSTIVGPWVFGVVDKVGAFQPYDSYIVNNVPAYQRRRKQGVGA